MFRSEVTQSDAIAAVVCMESSMTTSAILDGMDNVLHTGFPDNPDEECILFNSIVNSKYVQSFGFHCSHWLQADMRQEQEVLAKLDLLWNLHQNLLPLIWC